MNHEENQRLQFAKRLRRIAGSTLMSALLATAVIGATTVGGVTVYRQYQTNQFATNRAVQIGTVLAAADKYARKNETAILNVQPVAGFANPNSPTVAELTIGGFMTAGFTDAGQNGGPIKVAVRLEPTGCTGAKCQMAVSAYPTGSITDKAGKPDALLASKIAGALPNGSGWTNLATDVTKLAKNSYLMPNPLGSVPAVVVAQEWIGSNQPSATVPPVSYETNSVANCTYGGSTTYQRSVTTDKWGAVTYGSWVYLTDSCAPPPPPPPPPPAPSPSCANGASDYPTCTPPTPPNGGGNVCANGASNYPTCTPLTCTNGATNYPTCTLPKCTNGASDYPTCTQPKCSNGATDYPTCTPPVCANGATDYPTCTPPQPNPPVAKVCASYSRFSCTATGTSGRGLYKETDYVDDGSGSGTCVAGASYTIGACGYTGGVYWFNEF